MDKKLASKRDFQLFLGSLLYVSKCVRYSRFFLNRLLQNLRDHSDKKFIKISHQAHRDIAWFNDFVDTINGKSIFVKNKIDYDIHLDACPKGIGAVFKNLVYEARFQLHMTKWDIAALEMVNILIALRLWKHL